MNSSVVHMGDYGTGEPRERQERLREQLGEYAMTGKNGYKLHSSLSAKEIAGYLKSWRRFAKPPTTPAYRHWSRPW